MREKQRKYLKINGGREGEREDRPLRGKIEKECYK
jgi:hypothetical protein